MLGKLLLQLWYLFISAIITSPHQKLFLKTQKLWSKSRVVQFPADTKKNMQHKISPVLASLEYLADRPRNSRASLVEDIRW